MKAFHVFGSMGWISTLRKDLEANVFVDMLISYWHKRKRRKQGPAMDLIIMLYNIEKTDQ